MDSTPNRVAKEIFVEYMLCTYTDVFKGSDTASLGSMFVTYARSLRRRHKRDQDPEQEMKHKRERALEGRKAKVRNKAISD